MMAVARTMMCVQCVCSLCYRQNVRVSVRGHPVCVRAQVRSLMKDSTLGGMHVKQMIS